MTFIISLRSITGQNVLNNMSAWRTFAARKDAARIAERTGRMTQGRQESLTTKINLGLFDRRN
jgi:hypothetical protein